MATYQGIIEITQGNQSIANNTSTVTYVFKIVTTGASTYGNASTSATISYSEGNSTKTETVSVGTYNFKNNSTLTIASRTVTVSHNADGSKSVSASLNWQHGNSIINNTTGGPITGSSSKTLTTIARASSFSAITGSTIGSPITINITRASSSFTHTLWYSFGKKTWQLINSNVTTATSFTPPLSLASEIPNSASGTLTLILRTYSGNTQIGSDVYKTMTISIPDTMVPTISSVLVSEATAGIQEQFACYVKGKSTLEVGIQASGIQGSSIKSYMTTIAENTAYSGASFTSSSLAKSGLCKIVSTATDSRGKTSPRQEISIEVIDYASPSISQFMASRCNEDGTINDDGSYIKFVFSYDVSPVNNKNLSSAKIQYLDGSTWIDIVNYNDYSKSGAEYISTIEFSTDQSWHFRLLVADYFTSIFSAGEVPTGSTLINFNANGEVFAIGKVSELEDRIEVNKKVELLDSLVIPESIVGSNIPLAGGMTVETDLTEMDAYPSFMGSVLRKSDNIYFNYISVRHQNGFSDGNNYGMSLYGRLTVASDIVWRQQIKGTWQTAKTLLDSSNYASYVLPLTGGTLSGKLNASYAENEIGTFRFQNQYIAMYESNDDAINNTNRKGWLGYNNQNYMTIKDESGGGVWFYAKNSKYIGYVQPSGANYNTFYPGSDNADYLGMSGHRWKQLYAGTTTIATSDRKKKKDFMAFDERYEKFFSLLKPQLFRFKDGDSNRFHAGYIAQDIEESLEACELTALDFAGFCKDRKKVTIEGTHDEKDVYDENGNPEYDYALRYSEFIALNTHMIQNQQKRIESLEKEVQILKDWILQYTNQKEENHE